MKTRRKPQRRQASYLDIVLLECLDLTSMSVVVETSARNRALSLAILLLSLGIGGWLRFFGLSNRGISHPEIYVPGIHLPEGISEPAQRDTIFKVLTGTFSSDTHPPGYYLGMFPWTRLAGTSLFAIRLPSAIMGLACIDVGLRPGRDDWQAAFRVAGSSAVGGKRLPRVLEPGGADVCASLLSGAGFHGIAAVARPRHQASRDFGDLLCGPDPGGCRDTRLFLDVVRYSHDLGSCPRMGRG